MKTSTIALCAMVYLAPIVAAAVPANFAQLMLTAVNAERAKHKLPPLCLNYKLQKAAQLHSKDQAANNFMGHKGSKGSTMATRITAQKFKWNSIAENVAAGQTDVAAVMVSWMNSPGHRTNILGNYKFLGTGHALNDKGTYKHYWTQKVATGSTEACTEKPPATKAAKKKTPVKTPVKPPATPPVKTGIQPQAQAGKKRMLTKTNSLRGSKQ